MTLEELQKETAEYNRLFEEAENRLCEMRGVLGSKFVLVKQELNRRLPEIREIRGLYFNFWKNEMLVDHKNGESQYYEFKPMSFEWRLTWHPNCTNNESCTRTLMEFHTNAYYGKYHSLQTVKDDTRIVDSLYQDNFADIREYIFFKDEVEKFYKEVICDSDENWIKCINKAVDDYISIGLSSMKDDIKTKEGYVIASGRE